MNDLLSTCAVTLAAGVAAGGLRWAALRRDPIEHRHRLWRRDIAGFGFATTTVLMVFGAARLAWHPQAGLIETIDRGEVALWSLGLFGLLVLPYRWFFGGLYRDEDWDARYGFLLGRFTPAMLFALSLLGIDAANRHWDRGLPVGETMTVAAPARPSRTGCSVDLQTVTGLRIAMPAEGAVCRQLAPGTVLMVPVRPGLFGARWVAMREVTGLP